VLSRGLAQGFKNRKVVIALAQLHSLGRENYAIAARVLCQEPGAVSGSEPDAGNPSLPSPKDLSLTLNAFARGGFSDSALLLHTYQQLEKVRLELWSPRDLALLCNALSRMKHAPEVRALRLSFMERVAGVISGLAPNCSAHDTVQFCSVFASLPQDYHATASASCRSLIASAPLAKHVASTSLEGLCAILNALVRLRIVGDDGARVFRDADERIRRVSFQLSPAHLSHLSNAFSFWPVLQTQLSVGGGAQPSTVYELRDAVSLFTSTLFPAMRQAADAFEEPRYVAFCVAAVARVPCASSAKMEPLEALASQLLRAQTSDHQLRWERFPATFFPMMVAGFASLDDSSGEELEHSVGESGHVVEMLESLTEHLLMTRVSGGLNMDVFSETVVCKLAGSFLTVQRGSEVCQAAVQSSFAWPVEAVPCRDLSLLLMAMDRFELRDDRAIEELLWRMHWRLWHAVSVKDATDSALARNARECVQKEWDLNSAATTWAALRKLGALSGHGERGRRDALATLAWAAGVLVQGSVEGSWAERMQPKQFSILVPGVVEAARSFSVSHEWTDPLLQCLAHAASLPDWTAGAPFQFRHWCRLLRALCLLLEEVHRVNEAPDWEFRDSVGRLALQRPSGHFDMWHLVTAVSDLVAVGIDTIDSDVAAALSEHFWTERHDSAKLLCALASLDVGNSSEPLRQAAAELLPRLVNSVEQWLRAACLSFEEAEEVVKAAALLLESCESGSDCTAALKPEQCHALLDAALSQLTSEFGSGLGLALQSSWRPGTDLHLYSLSALEMAAESWRQGPATSTLHGPTQEVSHIVNVVLGESCNVVFVADE